MSIISPLLKKFMGGHWSQDQGVDINGGTSAIAGSPLLALGSGTIVHKGIGGFGADAPVLKLDTPINGYRYVYYGHAGPGGPAVGTHVQAGGIVGYVGRGIVGISTGPHLEIGFSDANGTPAPGSSNAMLAALKGAAGASAPNLAIGSTVPGLPSLNTPTLPGVTLPNPIDAITQAFDDLVKTIADHAKYAGLVLVAIVGGFYLMSQGAKRATHAEAPA